MANRYGFSCSVEKWEDESLREAERRGDLVLIVSRKKATQQVVDLELKNCHPQARARELWRLRSQSVGPGPSLSTMSGGGGRDFT